MRHYYSVDTIRAAEAPLLASLPDGALMRRAAFGLATEIGRELTARTGGVVGRRVCAVVGSGDNGGDALWAATFLRRRGAAADAVLLNPDRTHRKALAAFTKSGVASSRVSRRRPISSSTGGRHLRLGAAATGGRAGVRRGSGRRHTGGRRRHPQRHRCGDRGDHRPRRARRADRHLWRAQTGARAGRLRPRRPCRYRAGPGAHRRVGFRGYRRGRALAGARSPRRQIHPGRDRRAGRVVDVSGCGRAVHRAAVAATSGMVRYAGTAHAEVLAHWPEVIASPTPAAAGRVQAWVVGPGLGTDEAGAAALWFALDTDLPVLVDADGLTMLADHPDLVAGRNAPTVLTPHAGEFARLAGAPPGDDRVGPAASWPTRWAPPCCSRAMSPSSPIPAARSISIRPASPGRPPPGPVTCCPG